MSATERSYSKSSFQVPALSENVLLALVAAAFLVLHIVAGVILINASGSVATITQEEAKASHYD